MARAGTMRPVTSPPPYPAASRRDVDQEQTSGANRSWWDAEAGAYYAEHGGFLGDSDVVWGPEGLRESEARLLGDLTGCRVLEIGAGAAQCSRWVAGRAGEVVASDLSVGMLRKAATLNADVPPPARVPLLQCDGVRLPFAAESFDVVFTAYGVLPFVADSAAVMVEVARVLRPGGRFVFSTTHPFRWALPDEPDETGLRITASYFDRTPYVETGEDGALAYVEHHRTLGDRVREATAAGLQVLDLVEPEWQEDNEAVWGGWSPLRGRLVPGTMILVTRRPDVSDG